MALTRCFCLFKRATIHVMWLLLKSFIFEDLNDKWENNWYFCCHVKYFLFKKNVLRENHLFWFCLLSKKWWWKHFPFFFFNVFIINILYTVAESGKKISAGPNYTTLICLNIQYHLKYANIQILHEKLFLMNGKGRKCPKCLTIKINFFLIKKKKQKSGHTIFSKKKKYKRTRG